jgi:hypothetical protein
LRCEDGRSFAPGIRIISKPGKLAATALAMPDLVRATQTLYQLALRAQAAKSSITLPDPVQREHRALTSVPALTVGRRQSRERDRKNPLKGT